MKLQTQEEAKAHLLGKIAGINEIRIAFWGIGYDKDETASKVRKITNDKIFELKEILEIDSLGESMFSDAVSLLKKINKE